MAPTVCGSRPSPLCLPTGDRAYTDPRTAGGDYVSFSKHMKHLAGNLGVDLLIVDTG